MKKWSGRAAAVILAAILLSGVVFAAANIRADAGKSNYNRNDFTVDVTLSVSDQSETYDIKVEITNSGEDFEGTVRLLPENGSRYTCAYDTEISLSQGTTKQFTVSIPMNSLEYNNSSGRMLHVTLLDQKGNAVRTDKYRNLFDNYQDKVSVGILSDAASMLSYLEMPGNSTYIVNDYYPIRLVTLTGDTLAGELAGLDYLIIDQYDTSALSAETIGAVMDWVDRGGMLIFGTGNYAYEVLSGFDPGWLGTECIGIYDAATGNFRTHELIRDIFSTGNDTDDGNDDEMYVVESEITPYEYYGVSADMYLSRVSEVDTAFLTGYSVYDNYYHYGQGFASVESRGMGSISYYYYSFSDPDISSAYLTYEIESIYTWAADVASISYSTFHRNSSNGTSVPYNMSQALRIIDMQKSNLNYAVLKIVIILYVVLVGPVVYLVLSKMKKREMYWAAVPALALIFVGIISLIGRGFRIADTTVCSVTCVDAGESGETSSFMYAYSAGHDEWQMALADDTAYAGPLGGEGWSYDPEDYKYHVVYGMSEIGIGIRPDSSFEGVSFQRKSAVPTEGELILEDVEVRGSLSMGGKVINRTGYDIAYFLVVDGSRYSVVRGVANGETLRLDQADDDAVTNGSINYSDDLLGVTAERYYDRNDKLMAAQMAALYVGFRQADKEGDVVVVGVVPNYERVTKGSCAETSYGVFYSTQGAYTNSRTGTSTIEYY